MSTSTPNKTSVEKELDEANEGRGQSKKEEKLDVFGPEEGDDSDDIEFYGRKHKYFTSFFVCVI